MSGTGVMLANAIVFSVITLWYWIRNFSINIGVLMLGFYTLIAWGGYLYHEHEWFELLRGKESFTIGAFIYLDSVLFLFLYPLMRYKSNKIKQIELVREGFMMRLAVVTFIVQLSLYVVLIPSVAAAALSPDIGEFRQSQYGEEELIKFPNYFFNLLCRIYMGARNIITLMAAYMLVTVKRHKVFLTIFFATSFFFPIYYYIAFASRAVMVVQFIFAICLVSMLSPFIMDKIKKKIAKCLLVLLIPIVYAFIYISNSRFGDMATYMFYRYLGESFNNYNAQLFNNLRGSTYGTAYFNLIRKLMGAKLSTNTTNDKWDYIEGITGVDASVFYTFVGGLNIEFGYVSTAIIGIVLCFLIIKGTKCKTTLTLSKFILLGMLIYALINGAFFFPFQGDSGNLELFLTFIAFIFFNKIHTNKYKSCVK